jgi:outer membrane receptor for ferrienterochelin and colicins
LQLNYNQKISIIIFRKNSMAKYIITLLLVIGQITWTFAQNTFTATVKDATTSELLIGVSVLVEGNTARGVTDSEGRVVLSNLPNGTVVVTFSYIGYAPKSVSFVFPQDGAKVQEVMLESNAEEMDEIIVESTRANKSIANIPTRVEALTDEIDEAASMEPSRISHLITHTTGVQVQTTSAGSNGSVLRIQGMNGRYSKILKDGFPLYGGFSGSLDITQIPPLDLRQVEFIKGSSSTLHGGGAIAGVLNLLSKTADKDEILLHFNRSNIGSNDLNAFVSRKFGKFGITNLVSYQLHQAYDADEDGYSDLPDLSKFNFNPKLFYYPNKNTTLYFGGTVTWEFRQGGDMQLLKNTETSTRHFYSDRQETSRYTTQFKLDRKIKDTQSLIFKNSFNVFDRYLNIRQDTIGTKAIFGGRQQSSFSELTYDIRQAQHELIFGANYTSEVFKRRNLGETDFVPIEENHQTASLFANHIWEAARFLDIESGLRADWNQNSSNISEDEGEIFVMPRVAALIKYNSKWTTRLGGGLGYRPLTVFNEEAEPFGFKNFVAVDFANATAENSIGLNGDIGYKSAFGDHMLLSLNQMFFYNSIRNPIAIQTDANGNFQFANASNDIKSQGFETQVKFTFWKITWFLGYTYTDVYFDSNEKETLILNPKHSVKGDFLFVEDGKWRIGLDYEYKSGQRLSNGQTTRDLFTTGLIIERTLGDFVLFFNAENMTDTRQTRFESILSQPYNTPQFTEIWAPLDGRFLNFGLKIKLE